MRDERRAASIRYVCADSCVVCTCSSLNHKRVSIIAAKSDSGRFEINTHGSQSSLDVDVLCVGLLTSSLCSLRSPSTYSAQTCFALPPLNSLLSGRDQRSGTPTCPEGGWRTPQHPLLRERCAAPHSLYFVYTWVFFSPLDHLSMCRKTRGIQFPPLFWTVRQDQYLSCIQLYAVIVWENKGKNPTFLSEKWITSKITF